MLNNLKKPRRQSIRLQGYDYSENGAYFITVCTNTKAPYFETYPELNNIVQAQWETLPERFPTMIADAFVVMPNHIHGVIILRTRLDKATTTQAETSSAPTIGRIVGAYKSLCIYRWRSYLRSNNSGAPNSFWQRNYYEHVVRNEEELNLVREYILFNPFKWSFDRDNLNCVYDNDYLKKWQWLEG
jgi:putative transposase